MIEALRRLYHLLPRPPSTNYNLRQLTYNPYEMLSEGALVLDVGSKSALGRYAFGSAPDHVRVISLDIAPSQGVDVVADAHRLPFESQSVDCVLCIDALQYVSHPSQVVAEIFRVLKVRGLCYINTPFVFRDAPDPADLYRFSEHGMQILCAPFEQLQVGYNRGPASTMADLLVHFCAILFCFNSKRLYGLLVDLFQWGLFWIKYFDRWIGRYEVSKVIHNGVFFLGRRPCVPPCEVSIASVTRDEQRPPMYSLPGTFGEVDSYSPGRMT